jgi:putative transcriptional regulator
MSLRRRFLFTLLAAIVACVATDGAFRYRGQLRNSSGRSYIGDAFHDGNPFRAKSEMLRPTLLPVQSKSAEGLSAGKLLVASRDLGDPSFAKTVILLVQYDAQGVVGLILNRRTNVPLSRVLDSLKAAKNVSDPVYLGGPVDLPSVFALFKSPARVEGAERVFGRVYLIHDKTLFEQTISTRPDPGVFHVYLGYAGWTREQLRMEVHLGAWFVFPADASTVFNTDPDALWRQMIRQTEMKVAGNGDESRPAEAKEGNLIGGRQHTYSYY